MKAYLVIDIGTSSMRGIVYNEEFVELGRITKQQQPTYKEDSVEQDVESWDIALEEILQGIPNILMGITSELSGIFLTAQRSSLICLDKNYNAIGPAIMWQDKRANKIISEFENQSDLFIERTGARLNPVYLGAKIYFVKKKKPELYKNTYKFVSIADYLRYKLTGILKTDYTYASRTSLFNLINNQWDEDILRLLEIDKSKLCEIESVGQTGSYILPELSEKFGLGFNIPFISSGGDQQCSAVGMGVIKLGTLSLTLGSGGFLLSLSENIKLNNSLNLNYHSIPKKYLLEGLIISVATLLNYFHQTFFNELEDKEYYQLISDILKKDLKTDILHFPHYQGRGTPDWNNNAKGAYFNLVFSSSKEEMLFSVIESIGFEVLNNIKVFEEVLELEMKQIYVAGGIANNTQIIQLLSDITGLEFIKSDMTDSTAFGALIIGINAIKVDFNIEDFFEEYAVKSDHTIFKPNQERNEYYKQKVENWNDLYNRIYH